MFAAVTLLGGGKKVMPRTPTTGQLLEPPLPPLLSPLFILLELRECVESQCQLVQLPPTLLQHANSAKIVYWCCGHK